MILKDKEPITCRPGELLPPEDFEAIKKHLIEDLEIEGNEQDLLSYALYPKVFEDYVTASKNGDTFRYMGSDIFFHGLREGETCEVKIAEGKILVISLISASNTDENKLPSVIKALAHISALSVFQSGIYKRCFSVKPLPVL